jgi:hypothetical protein
VDFLPLTTGRSVTRAFDTRTAPGTVSFCGDIGRGVRAELVEFGCVVVIAIRLEPRLGPLAAWPSAMASWTAALEYI